MDPIFLLIGGVVAAVIVVLLLVQTYGRLLRKVGPNQALIVFGSGGTRVITGGSHFVIPLYQRAETFPLELMSFDVAPSQDLYTTQGVAVNVEAVTQIKVRSDEESVKTAAEQLPDLVEAQARYGVALVLSQEPSLGRQYLQNAMRLGNLESQYQIWAAWTILQAGYPEVAEPIVQATSAEPTRISIR